jgi:thymidine kinase
MSNEGKTVIVAGLDGTYEQKPFNAILYLISKSETVKKLSAVCEVCGHKASFTLRIDK